jgi:hypothetical protein
MRDSLLYWFHHRWLSVRLHLRQRWSHFYFFKIPPNNAFISARCCCNGYITSLTPIGESSGRCSLVFVFVSDEFCSWYSYSYSFVGWYRFLLPNLSTSASQNHSIFSLWQGRPGMLKSRLHMDVSQVAYAEAVQLLMFTARALRALNFWLASLGVFWCMQHLSVGLRSPV